MPSEPEKSVAKTVRWPVSEYQDIEDAVRVSAGSTFNGMVRSLCQHGLGKHENAERIRLYERHKEEDDE